MGDALVSAVVQTVLGNLNSVALQEIGLFWGLENELNKLQSIFTTIQLVIHDAELKQRKSLVIQNWLRRLKIAACDVENILDRIATEGLRRSLDSKRGMQFQFRNNPLMFRLKMAHKVRNIREKLDAIAEERVKFHLGEGVIENGYGDGLVSRETSSLVNEFEIYGREEEKEMIVGEVLDEMLERDDLSVYAIWGMGGLGKTTLAQMVYNDERMETRFELRIWVCVSDDFSIKRLVRAIIESIEGGGCNISELDPLQRLVQERLRGKRFLLVLDDVWSENHRQWDELKEVLRCGSKGSVLMVTTRIEKIALMMATIATHHIGYLSEDDSWSLFKKRAFTTGEVGDKNLVAIGKVIVRKCGGVPLAINALGSLMRFKSHESEWLAIKGSEIWHLSDDDNAILPALRLSYDNLLPQMRQCFAYCCIFPKDYVMEENQLIQLWMANGFFLPSVGQTDLHLTGHLIFKELVWRSFFQDVQINYRGNKTCKMHDLMHDLALSIMGHETYTLERGKVMKIPKTLLHLSFDSGSSSRAILDNKSKFKLSIDDSLRSLIVHGGEVPCLREGFSSFLSKQKYLRALDVGRCFIEKLPNIVCKLEHLRYLTMSCQNLKRLPESLTCLLNLQTLNFTDSGELLELPKGMKAMKNLWFLEIETFHSLRCSPPGLGDLTCLRGLSVFIVGQDASRQIDQLKELNLGGKLSIQGLNNVRNLEDAKSANMMAKKNLTSLSLCWTNDIKRSSAEEHFEAVLEGLEPHHNLEKICIKSYQGSTFPKWMTLACENLKEISLENCRRCDRLPPFGKLPSLTCLTLFGMDSIKNLDAEWHGDGESLFSALTSLTIRGMPNLEKWILADSIESFPRLEYLDINGCPKLTGLPFLPTLTNLSISDSSVRLLSSITSLTSLTSLTLFGFSDLNVFPEGLLQSHNTLEKLRISALPVKTLSRVLDNLSALKSLSIDSCSNLESLPEGLKSLNSLETLDISSCDGLKSFPATILEGLSSLRSLLFQNCKKLKPLLGPLQSATALQCLLINGCPEMDYLPDSLQRLSCLKSLSIWNCEGLRSLPNWLGSIESLSEMRIWDCENLENLRKLKDLKSLRRLDIIECPDLEKRCKKPKGEDWPKVLHINKKAIQRLDQ
ncbi:hypothetical protein BUALT_Bualt07G0104500 [Buddleja alternifolia]|uniref:Uncharacterized protein n=1 Tax=Buddleja alternifolia TaxID=168488 RepID=A0AAV6XAZ0_9LAMI|nr:hypothetical protein BUALT_Bualt07G0104500 [Buddleja alternifolia]